MQSETISDKFPYASKHVEVFGSKMHYIETGEGDPILFLHGIPTSSYIWRNVIPLLAPLGRCIAPDLIGFGKSDKPNIDYSITTHIQYIEKFIAALGLKHITLVMHGWGSVIGFDYAMRNEKNCKGLSFYEAFLRSYNGQDISLPFQEQINSLKDLENLSDMALNGTEFVDRIIPQNVMRDLTEEEMNNYRHPFLQKGTGKSILQYIHDLPKGDDRSVADSIIGNYSQKLVESALPKLLLYSVPGFITTISTVMWAKENLQNLEIAEIGEELHFAQESCPKLMGETISVWLQGIYS